MIKHKRNLGEDEARFRYVESLFIETVEGERYKLPFKNLTAGKAMLEHVRNGGRPYDTRGQHIAEMVNELTVLSRFRRANSGRLVEGDTASLVEQTNAYYENLQHNLKSLTTRRGYETYFESWSPSEITEESVVIEGLKHLFVTQSIDQRIEDALPLIARIQQQENAMKEANIFEAWVERLSEGTWQTPDSPEKQMQLIELMSQELPVGADATNATEQLYDLLGDDQLFDQLEELAERDANADARQVVLDRMQELSNDPDVRKVIEQLNIDATAEMNPPDAINPADLEPMNESRLMDSAGETISHILNRFKHEVKQFEAGNELDEKLYDALFDYYNDAGEMPYGVAKARDGDPMEWVATNLQSYLDGGTIMGGNPDEDYSLERESVMHGDYAEEKSRIRELAGLPAEEEQLDEFLPVAGALLGRAVVGAGAGALEKAAAGVVGSSIGSEIENMIGSNEVDEGAMKDIDIMRQDARNMNDVQFIKAHGMTKGQFKEKYKDLLKDEANPGVTPATIDGVPAEPAEPADRAPLVPGGQDNALLQDDDKCNMTESGESCPVHGMNECGSGYSTMPAMETAPDPMLSRLRTLAAIMVK
jgi:hypothetical protein